MSKVIAIPPGTTSGRLTVIKEARTPSGLRGMLCRCECGKTVIVRNDSIRAGRTKSCGCMPRHPSHRPLVVPESIRMSRNKVPLGGKRAAGRVALVDESDYELVMQYRWHIQEDKRPGHQAGPYARAWMGGKQIFMHTLITGYFRVDHADGNGLNNRRSNLRPATAAQNLANTHRRPAGGTSRYAGVSRQSNSTRWVARITYEGTILYLGSFVSEEEAALAYDKAARELYGEFARPNFPEGAEDHYRLKEMSPLEIRAMLCRVNPRQLRKEAGIRTCTALRALGIPESTFTALEGGSHMPVSAAGLRWARFVAGLERHAEVSAELAAAGDEAA